MKQYDFQENLAFSQGVVRETCEATISEMLTGCISVERAGPDEDRSGIDYWATLRRGARVAIDHKARRPGCSRYWKNGPELALEMWSVCPNGIVGSSAQHGKAGWTLDESKQSHYILFTFDPSDSTAAFLLPYQLLRMAFNRYFETWTTGMQREMQSSGSWKSECVFVPAQCVLDAIKEVSATVDPGGGLLPYGQAS